MNEFFGQSGYLTGIQAIDILRVAIRPFRQIDVVEGGLKEVQWSVAEEAGDSGAMGTIDDLIGRTFT